jgi:hypothetical protein
MIEEYLPFPRIVAQNPFAKVIEMAELIKYVPSGKYRVPRVDPEEYADNAPIAALMEFVSLLIPFPYAP